MSTNIQFKDLNLPQPLLTVLLELGYEIPTPVQEQSIPALLNGEDVLGQAQTGTGKTAAFALPILAKIDTNTRKTQALVITPTRELAIQVAEAFQTYARHIKGFHVTPIYGGQEYQTQLRALKRGAHVIVGTPGRLMDHMRRGTLSIEGLKTLVLDEADEMLRMGFIDDIEWILTQIPHAHQTALFSATIPASIKKIIDRYLTKPRKINISPKKSTVSTIEQCYIRVAGNQKLDVLTRFLEIEDIKAAIIFTRTKTTSTELAEKLQARGYAATALNGDMSQALRKKAVERIKAGSLDIIVATDVAARGLDVERVSHVINYDIPHDTESYIHRIGRTGRAGRSGKALLFVTPREQHLLSDIERAVSSKITQIEAPSIKQMNEKRSQQFAEEIVNVIEKSAKLKPYRDMVDTILAQSEHSASDIAAALAYMNQQSNPLPTHDIRPPKESSDNRGGHGKHQRSNRKPQGRSRDRGKPFDRKQGHKKKNPKKHSRQK